MNLQVNNVSYKYLGTKTNVLTNISINFNHNKIGLIGSSGSGKSTLIHLLNGMHKPQSGSITIGENTINNKTKLKSVQQIKKDVAIVYQFTDLQLFTETVFQEIMFAIKNFKITETNIDNKIEALFKQFNLELDLLKKSPFSLSGGQKKKISIISMLLINPKILILDEPSVGLDPQSSIDIINAINTLVNNGLKVIMISHDINLINNFCDHIIELKDGEVNFDGCKYEYFKKQYMKKNILLLPTELAFAATIDTENKLFEKIYSGEKLATYVKESNV